MKKCASCVRGANCSSLRARPAYSHSHTPACVPNAAHIILTHTLHAKVKVICDATRGTPDHNSLPEHGVPSRRAAARTLSCAHLLLLAAVDTIASDHALLSCSRRARSAWAETAAAVRGEIHAALRDATSRDRNLPDGVFVVEDGPVTLRANHGCLPAAGPHRPKRRVP